MDIPKTTLMAVLRETNSPLSLEEVSLPGLCPGQALVKLAYSGVCRSQLSERQGSMGPDKYIPHCLGHEGTGVVVSIGEGVQKVKPGDHVILSWIKGSGIQCQPVKYGGGNKIISGGYANTFTQYSIASENRLVKIPQDVPLDICSIIGCGIATGFGSVCHDSMLVPGGSIAIVGTGCVAINGIHTASIMGASKIIAIGRNKNKLELCKKFGATDVFDIDDKKLISEIKELSEGGVDAAIDAIGMSKAFELAFSIIRHKGKAVAVGVPHFEDTVTLNAASLVGNKYIVGSIGGSCQPDQDFMRIIRLYEKKLYNIEDMITHRFPFEKVNEALDLLEKGGNALACILEF